MPTEELIEATAVDLTEKLESVGYEVDGLEGPQTFGDQDGDRYYLYFSSAESNFYITFSSNEPAAQLVYPFNVARSIASQLADDERAALVEYAPELAPDSEDSKFDIGRYLANNCRSGAGEFRFNLSNYASSPLVYYDDETTEDGFPVQFTSYAGLLPYRDEFGLVELDRRTDRVHSAGQQGRRYVRTSLTVDVSGPPEEYELRVTF